MKYNRLRNRILAVFGHGNFFFSILPLLLPLLGTRILCLFALDRRKSVYSFSPLPPEKLCALFLFPVDSTGAMG
ncbi:MAG: hypothetical protein ACLQBD_23900 [Syntrophobacteraceae bacterium]